MNCYEKMNKGITEALNGISLIFEGLSEVIMEVAKALRPLFNCNQQPHKKPRLPRKTKKKYKKLGIYEDWKKENGL